MERNQDDFDEFGDVAEMYESLNLEALLEKSAALCVPRKHCVRHTSSDVSPSRCAGLRASWAPGSSAAAGTRTTAPAAQLPTRSRTSTRASRNRPRPRSSPSPTAARPTSVKLPHSRLRGGKPRLLRPHPSRLQLPRRLPPRPPRPLRPPPPPLCRRRAQVCRRAPRAQSPRLLACALACRHRSSQARLRALRMQNALLTHFHAQALPPLLLRAACRSLGRLPTSRRLSRWQAGRRFASNKTGVSLHPQRSSWGRLGHGRVPPRCRTLRLRSSCHAFSRAGLRLRLRRACRRTRCLARSAASSRLPTQQQRRRLCQAMGACAACQLLETS